MRLGKKVEFLAFLVVVFALVGCGPNTFPNNKSIEPLQRVVTQREAQYALEVALDLIGTPYIYGGRGPVSFDCSGLITYSYKTALKKENIFLIGSSYITDDATMFDLFTYDLVPSPHEELQEGDLVFISLDEERVTHGGMFIRWLDEEMFEFVNASSYFGEVTIDTWPIHGEKREQWYMGGGRLKVVIK